MTKTTTTTVRFIYDAKGRVKERIEETVTTETPDYYPYWQVEAPQWWQPPYRVISTGTFTTGAGTYTVN